MVRVGSSWFGDLGLGFLYFALGFYLFNEAFAFLDVVVKALRDLWVCYFALASGLLAG